MIIIISLLLCDTNVITNNINHSTLRRKRIGLTFSVGVSPAAFSFALRCAVLWVTVQLTALPHCTVDGFGATVARRQIYLPKVLRTFGGEKSAKLAKRTFENEKEEMTFWRRSKTGWEGNEWTVRQENRSESSQAHLHDCATGRDGMLDSATQHYTNTSQVRTLQRQRS